MASIQLIHPSLAYESQLIAYKNEFPYNPSGIEGSSQIAFAESIEQWLDQIEKNRHWETVQNGYMPAEQYIAIDNNDNVVGMLNFRKELNDYLLNYIGHIGYSVAPSKRRQGLATEMLKLALEEAKNFGLQKVLVTCTDDNIASYKVIENNGGLLEDKRVDPGDQKLTRRYWITL
ncbi:GNAT family N-acetyltransferase [Solibacillus daqui]|uniref:GNAT family N-acetyltransferase n=1 Tax=Solibacillus daqui TaxID=2912187 RepID=UPI0023651FA5|nr:GNAT family N-acetyltransferase [Solibacillus daqui]